jgi:hypothetical protein
MKRLYIRQYCKERVTWFSFYKSYNIQLAKVGGYRMANLPEQPRSMMSVCYKKRQVITLTFALCLYEFEWIFPFLYRQQLIPWFFIIPFLSFGFRERAWSGGGLKLARFDERRRQGGTENESVHGEDGGQIYKSHNETLFVHAEEPKSFKSSRSYEAAKGLL